MALISFRGSVFTCSVSAIFLVFVLLLLSSAGLVFGNGPSDQLVEPHPVWNFTMDDCSRFRNKTALLPYFKVWPEDIPGFPFRFCCEYQANDSRPYELANYRYGPALGVLEPLPYYDLGIVDRYAAYWRHWLFWRLPTEIDAVVIRCDMTDLRRLYRSRFYKRALATGAKAGAVLIGALLFVFSISFCFHERLKSEELTSDVFHLMVLALVGSCMMEAIGHSRLRNWRSQIMFNTGVVYTWLTLFAFASAFVRHCVRPDHRHVQDWRWQKVFFQFAALFMIGAYIGLVDDADGQALDSFAGIVLAGVAAACIWSSGVEMLVLLNFFTGNTFGISRREADCQARAAV